jgi:hypothetical protein
MSWQARNSTRLALASLSATASTYVNLNFREPTTVDPLVATCLPYLPAGEHCINGKLQIRFLASLATQSQCYIIRELCRVLLAAESQLNPHSERTG